MNLRKIDDLPLQTIAEYLYFALEDIENFLISKDLTQNTKDKIEALRKKTSIRHLYLIPNSESNLHCKKGGLK